MPLHIKPIDEKSVWERFISLHSPDSLFQAWNWGETIKRIRLANDEILKQCLWRLGLFNDDKLVGVAQVEKVIAKKGNFYHIRHGPIFSEWRKEYLDFLKNYLKDMGNKETIFFLRLSPQIENTKDNIKLFSQLGFRDAPIHAMDGEYVWVLDLDKSEEELLLGMRKTTRYLIKKAQKIGVKVEKSYNIETFLNLYKNTSIRQGFIPHKGLKEEFDIFAKGGKAILYFASYNGGIIAGALILFIGNQAIYHHGASLSNEIPASYLIQWDAILEAKNRHMKIYNFWGIAPFGKEGHPWKGLTLFKTGFGGRVQEYLHTQDVPFSNLYYFTYFIESLRRLKKGY